MTNLNHVAVVCMENSNHQKFQLADGANCVECKSGMMPTPVTVEEYRTLPNYGNWHRQRTQKPNRSVSIDVDANTDKLQLKLRAIAKHTEALADELDAIDNGWVCEGCGHDAYVQLFSNDNLYMGYCEQCKKGVPNDSLPTRLEGSE